MKHINTEIIVIAAGCAGLAAAITAAERGAKVIVFEKMGVVGGSANWGMGPFAVESRVQRLAQYPLTREDAFKIHMDFTQWHANARLVKEFIDKSASTIDWLEEMGVEFLGLWSHGTGMHYTWHVVKGPNRGAGTAKNRATNMVEVMANRARELRVETILHTAVTKIIKEGDRIIGVIAQNRDGDEIRADAKAVIIATGGYGGYSPPGPSGLNGDGIRMAREIGAAVSDRPAKVDQQSAFFTKQMRLNPEVSYTFNQPNLIVNLFGERFMNEEIMATTPFGNNAIATQKNRTAFNIFDEDTKRYYITTGWDFPPGLPYTPITKATNFDNELKKALEKGTSKLFVAKSIEELASKAGINLETLRKTLNDYNQACEKGCDNLFNKKSRYLKPVVTPNFYVNKITAPPSVIWEGIRVNHKTEVLTNQYDVIPGLYAAGIDAFCNIYYDTYPNVLPGNKMGFSLNSGRIAGENAVEYLRCMC